MRFGIPIIAVAVLLLVIAAITGGVRGGGPTDAGGNASTIDEDELN
jgi:hypothetical protein